MKILLIGNHSCSNRGDSAILRGLLSWFENKRPDFSIDVMTRFTFAGNYFLSRPVINDPLYAFNKKNISSILKRKWRNYNLRKSPFLIIDAIEGKITKDKLPPHYLEFLNLITNYDQVVQVGGSFFVDLYGINQFEGLLLSVLANKPINLIGHSIGPYENEAFVKIANYAFSKVNSIVFREKQSLEMYNKVITKNTTPVFEGSDTAWLCANPRYSTFDQSIAFTARQLSPFDKRLGVTQEQYENWMAFTLDQFAQKGFNILGVNTCTSFDRYANDDRLVAWSIKTKMKHSEKCTIEMNELNDLEFSLRVKDCTLMLGTRLHSGILAMNVGVPAFCIYYEHKSEGILKQMGLGDHSIKIEELNNADFASNCLAKIDQDKFHEEFIKKVLFEKSTNEEILEKLF